MNLFFWDIMLLSCTFMESTIIELCRSVFVCETYSLGVELWINILCTLLHPAVPHDSLCKSYRLCLPFWFFPLNRMYSISANASYSTLSRRFNLVNIIPPTQNNLCFVKMCCFCYWRNAIFSDCRKMFLLFLTGIVWSTTNYSLQKLSCKACLFNND